MKNIQGNISKYEVITFVFSATRDGPTAISITINQGFLNVLKHYGFKTMGVGI